jgi:hypothetical protein
MKTILALLFASICVFGCAGQTETESITTTVQAAEENADLSTPADEYLFLELSKVEFLPKW